MLHGPIADQIPLPICFVATDIPVPESLPSWCVFQLNSSAIGMESSAGLMDSESRCDLVDRHEWK
jgi:hypothetical protein